MQTRLHLAELGIQFSSFAHRAVIQHKAKITRAGNLRPQARFTLADQGRELFTAGPAEQFFQKEALAGLIELAQTAKDFHHQVRGVLQLLFQFVGRVAKFLEGFSAGPGAIKEELARAQVHFLEAIGQRVNADPVLVGDIGPFLKGFGLHPGAFGSVSDLGKTGHGLTNGSSATGNADARHRARDTCELFDLLCEVILAAPCDDDRAERRYASDDYLSNRIEQARTYIEERRAAEEEVDREEAAALEAARAILRERLVTEDGETRLAADAAQVAIAHLTDAGTDPEEAADNVAEATADVLRQLAGRADDRQRDPVAETKAELAEAGRPSILAALYDDRLVDDDGFMVRPDDAPGLYRKYKFDPKAKNAETLMRLEISDQMFIALNARVTRVVLDGEAKWGIRGGDGEAVRLWKEATISKLFINRGVSYWEGDGDKAKPQTIKPSDVITYARQRDTFHDTCFEPDPAKAAVAARRWQYNLWSGFAVQPRPGDWSKLRDHIRDQLCGGNRDHFNWVMTWLALIFAQPGVKVPSSIAVIGEQGTGKSKVFDWLRRAVGCAALKVSAARHLTGNFNAHLDGKVLLVCEEAFEGGDKPSAGVLKDLITSETLQIEGKHANLVERPNYVAVVFISNNSWVVPTDGEDARRFLVLHCLDTRKQDAAFFGAIDDQMENGGLEAMVHELTHWEPEAVGLSWASLRNPPVTDGLRQQAGMGLHGPAARLVNILESGVLSGARG